MNLRQYWDHLLPAGEQDPKFRDYLRRLSHSGLQTIAAVELAVPVLMQFAHMAVAPEEGVGPRLWQTAAMITVGGITLALSAVDWSRRHARLLAVLSAWFAPTLLTWAALWKPAVLLSADDYILTAITLVVLTVVATVPLRPWHTLSLGFSLEGMYILSCWLASKWEVSTVPVNSDAHHIFLAMLTCLATGISATNYRNRRQEFDTSQQAVRVAESLTGAQMRAQLAENAISIGKMAAALSHEINSPLGTLRSSIDTLLILTDRIAAASDEDRPRLIEAQAELRRTVHEAAERIDKVSRRLRRFVSLEDAELKSADINDLLADVATLHEEKLQTRSIHLEFDLERSIPPLTCRPQLLSAVFSNLLSNAIQAVNGDGRIVVQTRGRDSEVQVTVQDNGKGMSAEQADTIFEPSFRVDGGRVASGNWSLFNARQIVYEHGGEIRLDTAEGKGTTVFVTLPLTAAE